MKLVYNTCYGGFGLSQKAQDRINELKGQKLVYWDLDRFDPILVRVVEELGDEANTLYSALRIVDLPPGTRYRIDEYDGNECVETIDSIEWETAT